MRLPITAEDARSFRPLSIALALWSDKIVAVKEHGCGNFLLITAGGRFIRAGMRDGTWLVEDQPVEENPRG